MKQPKLERGKEDLISTGGNYLCGHILRLHAQAGLPENFQSRRSGAISDREVLMAMTGILCDGRSDFTNINLYAGDAVFANAFGIGELPSEATLRQRLDEMPQDRCHSALRQLNESILSERTFGTVRVGELDLIPVDIDVSPLDNSGSKKQGVSFTYKKHDGYAPIFAYIGSEGYMLDHELRPGSQHCQVGTAEFIGSCAETLERLRLAGRCLLRLDSGNDAEENFERFGDHYFIVKRNLRKEKLEQWLATARRVGELKGGTREGKNVYTGFVDHLHPGGAKSETVATSVAFEVIERLTDPDGNRLLFPQIEVNTYWTNLPCSAGEVIALYHDHGTSEQFHSELKTDLGVEQLPSGKFCVNQIVMLCAMIAFNTLRVIGQEVVARAEMAPIKIKVRRWRLKTVLQNIVYCAVRVIRHARGIHLHFGKNCPWFDLIEDIARARMRT
jgi:hypothetical protein